MRPGRPTSAKTAAEADLRGRDLDWTILRPGRPSRRQDPARTLAGPRWHVPRADVAAVIAALLDEPGTRQHTLELAGGDTSVTAAVHSIS